MENNENIEQKNLDIDDIPITEPSDLTANQFQEEIENFEKIKDKAFDIYKIIIDTRKFEIENFWKRTTFFWGALAIIAVGYFNAKDFKQYSIFLSYIGFFYNFIFSLSLRGSKYWQEHWEIATNSCEKVLNFKLFRLDFSKEIKKDNNKIFLLFRPIRKSVSKITMILSDITLFFWIVLVYKDFNGLINKYIFFDFGIESEFHFFTFIVLVTPFIFSFYIIIFWIKGSLKRKENNSV